MQPSIKTPETGMFAEQRIRADQIERLEIQKSFYQETNSTLIFSGTVLTKKRCHWNQH